MIKELYTIALACKEFADRNITFFKQLQAGNWVFFVTGANKQYEALLLSLCKSAQNKYPIIAKKLKEHVYQYDNDSVIHQSAIDELVGYIIALEQTILSDRKIFVSHASADASIVNSFAFSFTTAQIKSLTSNSSNKPNAIFDPIPDTEVKILNISLASLLKNPHKLIESSL